MSEYDFYRIIGDIRVCASEYKGILIGDSDNQGLLGVSIKVNGMLERSKSKDLSLDDAKKYANSAKDMEKEFSVVMGSEEILSDKINSMMLAAIDEKLNYVVGEPLACLDDEDRERWQEIKEKQKGAWGDINSDDYDFELIKEISKFKKDIKEKYKDYEKKEIEYLKVFCGIGNKLDDIWKQSLEIKKGLREILYLGFLIRN